MPDSRSTSRVKVYKMAGHWIWSCSDPSHSESVGEEYVKVRDPWCVTSVRAQQHADLYHSTIAGEDVNSMWDVADD